MNPCLPLVALGTATLVLLPGVSAAATGAAGGELGELPWGRLFLSLGLVLGLILALAWAARRYAGVRGGGVPIRILGGQSLGARERVILIEVSGRRLLLGVAPGRVQTLSSWESGQTPSDPGADFRQTLDRRLGDAEPGGSPS